MSSIRIGSQESSNHTGQEFALSIRNEGGEKSQKKTVMQPFIPAKDLKQQFGVYGHFYSVELPSQEIVQCRSVLEIASHDITSSDHNDLSSFQPDTIFIMMNPGSSKPLVEVNNRVRAKAIRNLRTSLVPTRPDTTQYQVMRLMHFRQWQHVRVLNLSDLRSPKSAEFIKTFERLEQEDEFEAHSIFSDARAEELTIKLSNSRKTSLVLAWGISDKLSPLIERCLSRLPKKKKFMGLLEPNTTKPNTTRKYRHPLPSLHKQQRQWVEQMLQQFDETSGLG